MTSCVSYSAVTALRASYSLHAALVKFYQQSICSIEKHNSINETSQNMTQISDKEQLKELVELINLIYILKFCQFDFFQRLVLIYIGCFN